MKSLITSRHLYYGSLIATVFVLVVSFTHIAKAVIAFEMKEAIWVTWSLAGGSELFLVLSGFGLGEIIKYRAQQSMAKMKHSTPIFPKWMLVSTVVGLIFFTLWILWGNFYYTSVVAVNDMILKANLEAEWINSITWDQLKEVDTFHLVNSYISALALPFMAFMGSLFQTIFDTASQRTEINAAKSRGAKTGSGGNGRTRKPQVTTPIIPVKIEPVRIPTPAKVGALDDMITPKKTRKPKKTSSVKAKSTKKNDIFNTDNIEVADGMENIQKD